MGSGLMYGKLCLFVCITHTEMSLKDPHNLLSTFLTDTLDCPNIFLNLPKVDGRLILSQLVSIPHEKGLQLLTGHLLYGAVGVTVDDFV